MKTLETSAWVISSLWTDCSLSYLMESIAIKNRHNSHALSWITSFSWILQLLLNFLPNMKESSLWYLLMMKIYHRLLHQFCSLFLEGSVKTTCLTKMIKKTLSFRTWEWIFETRCNRKVTAALNKNRKKRKNKKSRKRSLSKMINDIDYSLICMYW